MADEYIKREDALKAICSDCLVQTDKHRCCSLPCIEYERVKKIPAADVVPTPKWRSVVEAPPTRVGDDGYTGYLVYSDGYIQTADYTIDGFDDVPYFHVNGEYEPNVTHWMPLPRPPLED